MPFCFEASVGLPSEGKGTPLDTLEPIRLELPGNRFVRIRGRIDRVDEVPATVGRQYTVWDYKTGSSWRYRKERAGAADDPFLQGRLVQSALYLSLAENRLRESVSPEASVVRFGYFFPTAHEHGERVEWRAEELVDGGDVLGRLCEMLAQGAFPFTEEPKDVAYSAYRDAFGDVHDTAEASLRKLENRKNEALGPFRRLRGYDPE
jgi:hypothetical protein